MSIEAAVTVICPSHYTAKWVCLCVSAGSVWCLSTLKLTFRTRKTPAAGFLTALAPFVRL